ncbi:SMC family ATPase [Streptomyces spororaveus]|uniref:Nuclease SbcCD subunit C n=1 Tax=Streptomyces spororaveus TaxID=284039 RepID=A0ABQ3TND0_9ACTN|nr:MULTISPECIES: SMC family ATPase [Streptomyces]MCX5307343.1 SMC family ATPase [Streptomyces sp. NBC_00160]GHI81450.1 nuclease SbcCD subunit C [Streptomyces spororaveus]
MRLHRLAVTAFGPFAEPQEIDFDALSEAGVFLLHGPTGAGKTSVLDAVCYALYGSVPGPRQAPGTSLRSDHAAAHTPTEVTLELTAGGRRLELTRRPEQERPKKRGTGTTKDKAQSWLREHTGEGWEPLSRSHQEIGEEIEQLLGMSREQFCQVVLLPQGEFARFLRADEAARGRLLGRLFDTRRFAAVEALLGERRRAAEARVRAGDEKVLHTAQRLAQAAGDSADLRAWPMPGHQPGDPGLAEAVRAWAAVARCAARESLDVAEYALAAVESRHAAARHAAEDARELDRLQRRHAETVARAARLAEAEPERDRVRSLLDRARRGSLVAPALELRGAASAAHLAAAHAETSARAQLPPTLKEAGAEQLADIEQRLREALGALGAAQRAEQRSAEIGRERADLERESRAAEEQHQESAEWLERWEATRTALQERADGAQQAATLAEQLAGRLEPARMQLNAARRRDELDTDAERAAAELLTLREESAAARESWLELKEARLRGIAAELAEALVAGEACTVCGSAEHPAPARPAPGHVDRAAEDAAHELFERAERARAAVERRLAAAQEARAEAQAAAGDATTAELLALTADLSARHAAAHAAAAGLHAAREQLARAEREHATRSADRQGAETRAAARASRREALDREQAGLEAELTLVRDGAPTVAARARTLEDRVRMVAGAATSLRRAETTAARLKEADDQLADAAFKAGFDTIEAAADAVLPEYERTALQHRLDAWQTEEALLADRRRETGAAEAAALPPAAPDAAEARAVRAAAELRTAGSAADAARLRCTELDRLSRQAELELRALGPLREAYDRVARLAGLTAGTSADNERKMRLEAYVLAARLEQVAAAATVRLLRMSGGRYTLVHSDARAGGRGRSGLGLHVVDAWTGSERDTATLSGGETFFASLALALGLADVVTDEAGGVRLDTLFIDEGFGSLDDQALDEVLDVLDSLRERDRSVGIVSHVADLRTRVQAQLEIVKQRGGSVVRHRTAALTD